MSDEILKPEDEQAEAEEGHKKLMEQIKAAITVYRQKNRGEIPSLQDITAMLEEIPAQEGEEDLPKCLKYLAYFGKSEEKPVYYEDPEGMCFFDTHTGEWTSDRPPLLDELNARDIKGEDMFDMVLHGIMDDNDYGALEKAGMVDDRVSKLYHKINGLKQHAASLQKSVDEVFSDEEQPDDFLTEPSEEAQMPDLFEMSDEGEDELPGENLIEQIMNQALSPAQNPKLQALIQAEIQKFLGASAPTASPEAPAPAPVPEV